MKHTPTHHELMAILAGVAVLAALTVPGMMADERTRYTTECRGNLKNVATALEMYSTDFGGRFPPALEVLVPNYLLSIPSCPAAGQDTYSGGYSWDDNPDKYSLSCAGFHHPDLGPGRPAFTVERGCPERP